MTHPSPVTATTPDNAIKTAIRDADTALETALAWAETVETNALATDLRDLLPDQATRVTFQRIPDTLRFTPARLRIIDEDTGGDYLPAPGRNQWTRATDGRRLPPEFEAPINQFVQQGTQIAHVYACSELDEFTITQAASGTPRPDVTGAHRTVETASDHLQTALTEVFAQARANHALPEVHRVEISAPTETEFTVTAVMNEDGTLLWDATLPPYGDAGERYGTLVAEISALLHRTVGETSSRWIARTRALNTGRVLVCRLNPTVFDPTSVPLFAGDETGSHHLNLWR